MSWKAHGNVLKVNRCQSQEIYPGEREVESVMRPPLDLTSRHQMASLSFEKNGEILKNRPN
jgi:hypothetical protein